MSKDPSLSPAAAYVMSNIGHGGTGREALKIATYWLASIGALRIEDRPRQGVLRDAATVVSPGVPMSLPGHAHEVVKLAAGGVAMDNFIARARERFGPSFSGFGEEIRAELLASGLIEEVREKTWLWFTKVRSRRTLLGAELHKEAMRKVSALHEVPGLLGVDPARAASLAAAAGGLVFLVPELRPHFPALVNALRAHPATGDGGSSSVPFDTTLLFGMNLGFGEFNDSFDDAAGGDSGSGGDGSGGDGGSGGGD